MITNLIYIITFIIAMPLIWYILLASNLEKAFKQGKIWQIRIAYILITLIGSHLLASLFQTFVGFFINM